MRIIVTYGFFLIAVILFIIIILLLENAKIRFRTIVYLIPVSLVMVGIFNIKRWKTKKELNENLKILTENKLIINNKNEIKVFEYENIKQFKYTVEEKNVSEFFNKVERKNPFEKDKIFEGKLFLIDKNDVNHLIIGIDDKREKYIDDDLTCIAEYFCDYLLKTIH